MLVAVWGEARETPADKLQLIAELKARHTQDFLAKADLAQGRALYAGVCGQCHKLFGAGGGDAVASRLSKLSGSTVEVLGQVPISVRLRECSDAGTPVVLEKPDDVATVSILGIAEKFAEDRIGLSGRRLKLSV